MAILPMDGQRHLSRLVSLVNLAVVCAGSYVDTMPSSADVIFDCIRVTWVVSLSFRPLYTA